MDEQTLNWWITKFHTEQFRPAILYPIPPRCGKTLSGDLIKKGEIEMNIDEIQQNQVNERSIIDGILGISRKDPQKALHIINNLEKSLYEIRNHIVVEAYDKKLLIFKFKEKYEDELCDGNYSCEDKDETQ